MAALTALPTRRAWPGLAPCHRLSPADRDCSIEAITDRNAETAPAAPPYPPVWHRGGPAAAEHRAARCHLPAR